MRIMLAIVFGAGLILAGCAVPKPEANPDKYADYRSDSELLERLASLQLATDAYEKKGGAPDKMTGRRELGQLSDEIAANQLRDRQQIERVLAQRYHNGDKKAYFEGIEKVKLTE